MARKKSLQALNIFLNGLPLGRLSYNAKRNEDVHFFGGIHEGLISV